MELQQLKYFVQVAQMESISKAAESLHVSQPAVSRSIIRLEEELGAQLFDRIGKRVCLNDVGVLFLGSVEKALQDLNQAASLASSANRGVEGSLGVVAFGPQRDAIGCVVSFMKDNPSVRMTFNARQRSSNPQIVRDFDLVFYPEGPSFASISGIPYARTRTLLCVPADHPLAHRGRSTSPHSKTTSSYSPTPRRVYTTAAIGSVSKAASPRASERSRAAGWRSSSSCARAWAYAWSTWRSALGEQPRRERASPTST